MKFAETAALCVYYREPYAEIVTAIRALTEYVRANSVDVTGAFRSIYLEGSPNQGENSEDYITRISVPAASILGAGNM